MRVALFYGCTGLVVGYERYNKLFLIFRIGENGHFAFAGKPSESCEDFFVFELGHLFDLFYSEGVSIAEGYPNRAAYMPIVSVFILLIV